MKTVEETGQAVKTSQSSELMPSAAIAEKQFQIQGAIVVAQKFKRNEDQAFEKLMKACGRSSFAEEATYAFPRGGRTIKGPSVNLAREAARVWGNIQYGLDVIRDDDEGRQIQGWAWDVETNVKVTADDTFKKLIQRKTKDGKDTQWIVPDERDLRELTNRRGAICVRNCILQLIPRDLVEDALKRVDKTLRSGASDNPEETRKAVIIAFSDIGVTAEMLQEYLGHRIATSSPSEIANLRSIFKSIEDGNSTWQEYGSKRPAPDKGSLDVDDLKKSAQDNRGHGKEGFDAQEEEERQAILISARHLIKQISKEDERQAELEKIEAMTVDSLIDYTDKLRAKTKKKK